MSEIKENSSGERESHSGHHHHSGSGHGHSRHRKYSRYRILRHRFRRWLQKRKWVGVAAVILVAAAIAGLLMLKKSVQQQSRFQIVSSHQVDVGSGYREIEYEGKRYRYNNRVTTILYAGVDSDGFLVQKAKYGFAPRADSVSLIVLDELHQRMTIIALNRSTVTGIHRYTLNGRDRGVFDDFLCWAYSYGDGGKVSCENLCDAVSRMLFNIPINGYVVSNRTSLPLLADAIGPVTVTVPNDDLAALGFVGGETAVIDSSNLETFVRSRDTETDFSNTGRMERQQAYIESAVNKLLDLLTNKQSEAWETLEKAEDCVQTDITRSRYLDLTKVLKKTAYTKGSYYIPEGIDIRGPKYDEFYPNQEDLKAHVVELFYIEM